MLDIKKRGKVGRTLIRAASFLENLENLEKYWKMKIYWNLYWNSSIWKNSLEFQDLVLENLELSDIAIKN